jgi:hypothetical protein
MRDIVESEEFAAVLSHEIHNQLLLINYLQGVIERNCGK